ncbi:hypothetical protein SUGI_0082180 [Cryptomeria japonica]|nr:hypothetical protein SUGI_0082180 [Cryptomeria japonica]
MDSIEEEFGCDYKTQEDSISSLLSRNGRQSIPSCGLKRSVTGISQISEDPSNEKSVIEVCKKRGSSSQYRGVVLQSNGKWGAQIYEKYRRVWLGSFDTEEEAAQSYDTAAFRIRGHKAITNFIIRMDETHPEAIFLRRHSEAEIVNMLRSHTYHEELHNFYKSNDRTLVTDSIRSMSEISVFPREHLFDKALTPSDVGKLNRLVIPKHHAQRCFPLEDAQAENGIMLNFEDTTGKKWRFKYSYWSSSKSYVLTRGWRGFIRDKHINTGDIVTFHRSTGGSRQLYISFRLQTCNFHPYKQLGLGDFHVPTLSYSQSNRVLYLPQSIEHRSRVFNSFIPWLIPVPPNCSTAYDFFSLSSLKHSESDKRKMWPLHHPNLPRKILSSPGSAYPSRVMLFGVNLGLLSSSTSNPLPSGTADKKRE